MRRKDKEVTDPNMIEQILCEGEVCRLGMFDTEYPYIVPLNYGYYQQTLYFHTALSGKMVELLNKNNKVCFEIESESQIIRKEIACRWTAKYRSIIGYGEVEIVTDTEEKKKGLDFIMAHYGSTGVQSYNEQHLNNVIILKLPIRSLTAKQSGY